jgi:hypothetical protein
MSGSLAVKLSSRKRACPSEEAGLRTRAELTGANDTDGAPIAIDFVLVVRLETSHVGRKGLRCGY